MDFLHFMLDSSKIIAHADPLHKELHGIWLNMKSLTLLTACIDPVWIYNACNCEDICREKETSWNNGEFIHFHTSVCELHEFRAVRCFGLYEMDATFTPSFQREPHGDALHAGLEDNIWMSVEGLWCKHQQYDIQHWTSSHYETLPLTNSTNNSLKGEPILEHGCEENPNYSDPCWIFPLDLWISLKKGKRFHSARVCSRISIGYTGKCRAVSITTAVLLVLCSSAFQFELIYRKTASANLSKHNPAREMFSLCKE